MHLAQSPVESPTDSWTLGCPKLHMPHAWRTGAGATRRAPNAEQAGAAPTSHSGAGASTGSSP